MRHLNGGTYTKTATSGAQYATFFARASPNTGAEDHAWLAPCAGILKNLYINSHIVPGGTATVQIFLYKLGTGDTAMTCTLTAAITDISDTTHPITVAKGEKYCLRFVYTNTPAALAITDSLEFYPKPEGVA